MSWIIDGLRVFEPNQAQHRGGLAGQPLDSPGVAKARELEIDYFRQIRVFAKVPVQEARDGGQQVLGVRWIDVEKADGAHTSRARGEGDQDLQRLGAVSAMPPIESFKYLPRRAGGVKANYILHIDVARAYAASRDICIKLPARRGAFVWLTHECHGRGGVPRMPGSLGLRLAPHRSAISIMAGGGRAEECVVTASRSSGGGSTPRRSRSTWRRISRYR